MRPSASAARRLSLSLLTLFLLSLVFGTGCASRPSAPARALVETNRPFAKEINAFILSDRTNPPPRNAILFVGSSSIRLWKSLATDFPALDVINRGFGGSQIIDSVNYADLIVLPYRPRQIVMYAGGNDINARKAPEQVLADFRAFVERVRADLPKTKITYISIAPNPARWSQIEQVRAANRLIAEFTRTQPNLSFIDVHPHMLGPDQQPRPDIFVADRLHMNAKGYEIWREVVGPHLLRD